MTIASLYDTLTEDTAPGLDVEERNRIKRFQDRARQRHEDFTTNPPKNGGLAGGAQYAAEAELRGRWGYITGHTGSLEPIRRGSLAPEVEALFQEDCAAGLPVPRAEEPHPEAAPWDTPEWSNYGRVRRRIRAQYRAAVGDRRVKDALDVVADDFVRNHPHATKAEASRILARTLDRKPASVLDDIKKRRGIGKRIEWADRRTVRRCKGGQHH